jgi:ribosomal protein S11
MRDAVADTGLQFEELKEKRAVNLGCLTAVQRLQRRGCLSRKEYLCEAAARSGQLEKLKALRADDTPWDAGTCLAAASGGHLNVLQWLLANGCQFGERACASAAYRGHLEVLQWLRANGCPWNENTVSMAAGGGHLKVVLWACANGCPCDEKGLHYAAEKGHETAVRALIEAGADVNTVIDDGGTPLFMALRALIEAGEDVINTTRDNGVTALYVGAQNGRETVVRALFELGADINEARDLGATPLFIGAIQGNEAVVRALIEVGADVNRAADNGWSLEVQAERLRRGSGFGVKALKSEDIRVVARALRGIGQDNSGKLYRAHRIAALASSMSLEAQAEQLDVEVRINDTRLLP